MSRPEPQSRRHFLATSAGAFALTGLGPPSPQEDGLIVRSRRPLDVETPVAWFRDYLTPNNRFFIRSHLSVPTIGEGPWRFQVAGLVKTPRELALTDLARFPSTTVTAVLQCAGNGRSYFRPNIPGVGWDRGAVGNAEWGGVRLRDVLEHAGIADDAKHVHFLGADLPPHPKTPVFLRSLPLERALRDEVLLVTTMNGAPLPLPQGGPLRLVVPGWCGNHWMKWVRRITLAPAMAEGFYQQTAYRIPREPVAPGVDVPPENLDYVTDLNVKSLIVAPRGGAVLRPGLQQVEGVAWTGPGRVTTVEVAIDDGPWRPAGLVGPDRPFAWRLWRFPWDADHVGRHVVQARAWDSNGQVQADATPWNRSGYLWNGIDRVEFEVNRT